MILERQLTNFLFKAADSQVEGSNEIKKLFFQTVLRGKIIGNAWRTFEIKVQPLISGDEMELILLERLFLVLYEWFRCITGGRQHKVAVRTLSRATTTT